MATAWPLTLPQKLESNGFQKTIGSTTIRSTMDIGFDKLRKRYTKQINKISATMQIDRTQYATLENFYLVTLNGGINPFTFTDPVSNTASDYRFINPPTMRSIGGNYFTASMEWEQVP